MTQPDEPREPEAGSFRDEFVRQMSDAAKKSGLRGFAADEKIAGSDVLAAVGGVRGILEAVLPGLVFLVTFTLLTALGSQSPQAALVPSLIASGALAVLFVALRVIAKKPVIQAVAGLIGVAISAVLSLNSGDPTDTYVPGFFTSGGYALALLISVIVRWPIVGLIAGFLTGHGIAWRKDRRMFRVAQWLTLAWVAMFLARLVVQIPLKLAENLVALGVTRLLMGIPLYALLLIFTVLVARTVFPSVQRQGE